MDDTLEIKKEKSQAGPISKRRRISSDYPFPIDQTYSAADYSKHILSDTAEIYANKKKAVSVCISIADSPQTYKTHILSRWMFGTVDGVMILSNSVLSACADRACPYILSNARNEPQPKDTEIEIQVREWETALCETLNTSTRPQAKDDWTKHSITELLGNALYTLAFERPCLDVKTTWRWTSPMLILCPWGRKKPFHTVAVRDIDIRVKEALAGLLPARAFTTTGVYTLSNTHYASTFRFNGILEHMLNFNTDRGKCRGLLAASFLFLIVANFRKFCMFSTSHTEEDKKHTEMMFHIIRATIGDVVAVALNKARKELPNDHEKLSSILKASHAYVQKYYGYIIRTGLIDATEVKVKLEPGEQELNEPTLLDEVRRLMQQFEGSSSWIM